MVSTTKRYTQESCHVVWQRCTLSVMGGHQWHTPVRGHTDSLS